MSEQKTYVQTVTAGSERLVFLAVRGKSRVAFFVRKQVVEGKKARTVERGASAEFPDMASASKAVDEGVAKAVEVGWSKPARVAGTAFQTKADSFTMDALPKPSTVAAATEAPAAHPDKTKRKK